MPVESIYAHKAARLSLERERARECPAAGCRRVRVGVFSLCPTVVRTHVHCPFPHVSGHFSLQWSLVISISHYYGHFARNGGLFNWMVQIGVGGWRGRQQGERDTPAIPLLCERFATYSPLWCGRGQYLEYRILSTVF